MAFDGYLLNVDEVYGSEMQYESLLVKVLKANLQAKHLVNNLERLKKMMIDFSLENFDDYIDQHKEFAGEDELPYDPYMDLTYAIESQSITDLPSDISKYSEFLSIAESYVFRESKTDEFFDSIFPNLTKYVQVKDESGETFMMPENEIPVDQIEKRDIRKELTRINAEHCLDNYNKWYETINYMIKERKPFQDMLNLFE